MKIQRPGKTAKEHVELLKLMAECAPKGNEFWLELARFYSTIEADPALAHSYAKRALERVGEDPIRKAYCLTLIGELHALCEEDDSAMSCYRMSDALKPSDQNQLAIGWLYLKKGDFKKAEESFKEGLRLSSEGKKSIFLRLVMNLGVSIFLQGEEKAKAGKEHLDNALDLCSDFFLKRSSCSRIYFKCLCHPARFSREYR